MRIALKTLVFLLVFSMLAAQSQQVFLFAQQIDINPSSGELRPVVSVDSTYGFLAVQPLNQAQSSLIMTGTEETIKNIVSFSPSLSEQDTIEYARETFNLAGSLNSEQDPSRKDQPQNPDLSSKTPLLYESVLLADRQKEKKDKKIISDDTVDFFSKSALSHGKAEEGEGPSLEKALRAIFNQKLEHLYTGLELDDVSETGYSNFDEKLEIEGSDFVVVDVVNFTRDIRLIHQLLNPPERLHPWLKWLLYLGRVTPQMLEIYYGALQKRDQIFKLAFESAVNGDKRYQIRYQGKMMKEFPVYVMPEDAQGFYELVMAPDQGANTIVAQGSAGSQP